MNSTIGNQKPVSPRPTRRGLLLAIVGIFWALFIFATSCTVVRPQEFFRWIHEHLIPSDALFSAFEVFWGLAWFAVIKGWHAMEFAILLLLTVAAVNWITGRRTARNLAIGVVLCTAFAASDEWHQTFVPDRGGTVTDVGIDSLGVLVAAWILSRRLRVEPVEPASGEGSERRRDDIGAGSRPKALP